MKRLGKLFGVLGASCALVVCVPTGARAAPPDRGTFDISDQFSDPDYCAAFGFSFDVTYHEHGFFDVYFDSQGNVVRVVVHHHVDFVLTANGKSLIESDNFISIFTADNIREIGSFAHIQGDHAGIVLRDAGQIVFDAQDNLLYVRGPHPQFFGETFCAALAP